MSRDVLEARHIEDPERKTSIRHYPLHPGDVVVRWRGGGGDPDAEGYIVEANLGGVIVEGAGHYGTNFQRACEAGRDIRAAFELVEEIRRLREAGRRVAERRRRPSEGWTGWHDRLAEMFYRDTGHMAPGKSAPMEMHRDPEEDRRKWEEWLTEPYDALVALLPETGDE